MLGPTLSESNVRLKQTLATVPLYTGSSKQEMELCKQEMELCKQEMELSKQEMELSKQEMELCKQEMELCLGLFCSVYVWLSVFRWY